MTEAHQGLNILKNAVQEGRSDDRVRYRQQITTTLGNHNMPSFLLHQAKLHGLEATLDTGKGLLSRSRLITTHGTTLKTWIFWLTALEWMEQNA